MTNRRDHRPQRSLPVPDLRARAARAGARRGLAGVGRRRPRVPRLLRQHRGRPPSGTRIPPSSRAIDEQAQRDPARLQPALLRAAGACWRRAAVRRTRSPTASSSATAAPRPTRRRSSWRASTAHERGGGRFEIVTAARLVPRPHARDHRRHRPGEGARAASSRCRRASATCRTTTSAPLEAAHHAAHHRRHARADPGRRRHRRAAAPDYLRARARALRPPRPAADLRRGADRHGPHRHAVRLRAERRHARHHDAGQGPRRRRADRRHAGDRAPSPRASTPARTARPSAATRSPARSALAVLRDAARAKACWPTASRMGERLRAGLRRLRDAAARSSRDVRGRGLLVGAELDEPGAPRRRALPRGRPDHQLHRRQRPALHPAAHRHAPTRSTRRSPSSSGCCGMKRDFLSLDGFTRAELDEILHLAATPQARPQGGPAPAAARPARRWR